MATTDTRSPLLVDRRVGSSELFARLRERRVPCELTTLPFGDFAFATVGANGQAVAIGVERKRIRDFVQSVHTGRLAGHQLPGLTDLYTHRWLVIEGAYRVGRLSEQIEIRTGTQWQPVFSSLGFDRALLTLELRGGLRVKRTVDEAETAHFLDALHGWWTMKDFAEHRSHLALHLPPDRAVFVKPPLVQRVAAILDGIGFTKAHAVARHFRSVRDLVDASEEQWRQIPGIGTKLATRLHQSLRTR